MGAARHSLDGATDGGGGGGYHAFKGTRPTSNLSLSISVSCVEQEVREGRWVVDIFGPVGHPRTDKILSAVGWST